MLVCENGLFFSSTTQRDVMSKKRLLLLYTDVLQPGPELEFSWPNGKISFGALPLHSPEQTVQTEKKCE
jgi:hypothetical protein